jgi:uncharacterized repeat protein (TIGR03806 family)
MRSLVVLGSAAFLALTAGCSRQVRSHIEEPFPSKLSAWQLFTGKPAELRPNERVVPYDLNSPLFSDYATKYRFVWMPPGTSAVYDSTEAFEFPVGTVFSKTFGYPDAAYQGRRRLIETRLLVHGSNGWVTLPYVWNAAQTEAVLDVAADPTMVHWTRPSGETITINYAIPNANQCKECHDKSKSAVPIGPKARNLNKDFEYPEGRENQLTHWTRIGYLRGAPRPAEMPRAAVWDDASSAPLEARARTYLDINCGHCHRPEGSAGTSGLYLTSAPTDSAHLGVCKTPVSAGQGSGDLFFDIVDGKPEASILVHRMDSAAPKVLMPELGRTLIHREGVELIREWIRSMPDGVCVAKPAG